MIIDIKFGVFSFIISIVPEAFFSEVVGTPMETGSWSEKLHKD